jgi:2-polyprenyl-3-methyl-5-hydroxy-6-metoxy-1,4-benzoquinol methylase
MSIIICAAIFLIVLGLLSVSLLLLIFMADSIARGHDLPTSRRAAKSIVKIISEHKTARNFYDLGCARGALAVRIKRELPNLRVNAIDNDPIRIFFAKIRALLFQCNIHFLRKNIFDVDLGDADIVYTYLWYDLMPLLEKKLQKELKHGAIVITNTSNFPTWKPVQKIVTYPKAPKTPDFETLFVYQKTQ